MLGQKKYTIKIQEKFYWTVIMEKIIHYLFKGKN